MSNNEKKILENAMKKIDVPEEALTALETGSRQRNTWFRKSQYKWGEIIISSVVVVCLLFVGTLVWPKGEGKNKVNMSNASSAASGSAAGQNEQTTTNLHSTKYWKVQNEEKYFSFSEDKVRVIIHYFTQGTPRYTFKENQLDLFYETIDDNDQTIEEVHSYQVKKEGNNLVLEPTTAREKRVVLEPHHEEIFPYTEETIKKLKPAINPNLAGQSSWTSIIKGNNGENSTVIFDGTLCKEKIDGEERWLTATYEVEGNHLLINYGSYTVGKDMYWDGENIVLWPVSTTLPESNIEEFKEESVTILQPTK
ncbi:hypothetical protein UAY_01994 [Enterococcus moraviensis ATCC BAA-383]|uniref:Uncharacterized protein n=1 Tax=Enterococcus moraviensis ATCC BAA-383 TaxID=1158609 RepID=R2QRQ7_9ENTE|nr:hypothetical protein [Enterococcus moraviensis]EOH99217.1 hypothetical protein UAY_01994 [Enterococcus moraviensis ATCC BAA-383]EOT72100.1 hypothetical protein I586_01908 [Enterococcus moraviensis ATCC BAA-383]